MVRSLPPAEFEIFSDQEMVRITVLDDYESYLDYKRNLDDELSPFGSGYRVRTLLFSLKDVFFKREHTYPYVLQRFSE